MAGRVDLGVTPRVVRQGAFDGCVHHDVTVHHRVFFITEEVGVDVSRRRDDAIRFPPLAVVEELVQREV